MQKRVLILLCSVLIGLCGTAYLSALKKQPSPRQVAWWSLLYDKPNPDRLPVHVRFKWVKSLDS